MSLLQVARSLTIACVLDQKLELMQQQQTAGTQHVSGLVEDARAPLQALCTLGGMLAPRLEEGEPEQVMAREMQQRPRVWSLCHTMSLADMVAAPQDMANAMLVQGERLKAVIQQLQDAFRPTGADDDARAEVHYFSGSPSTSKPQLAAELSKVVDMSRLLTSSRSLVQRDTVADEAWPLGTTESDEPEWCNVTSILSDMLAGVSAMCDVTGINLIVGEGIQVWPVALMPDRVCSCQ